MKTKTKIIIVLMPFLTLMALAAPSVHAQPIPPPFIQNAWIRLTLGNGFNNQGIVTIVGMAPVKNLGRDIVWYGEYEYLSTVAPINGVGYLPGTLIPLWGPTVPRQYLGGGASWYSVAIGPVFVGGIPVTVIKTVTLISWLARIDYLILPLADMPQLYLYYAIDYCDGPVTGDARDNVWSFPPWWFEVVSRQLLPATMPIPPGGWLMINTKGTGVGLMLSWQRLGGSRFPIYRYVGYYSNCLYDTWPNGNPIVETDDDGVFVVDLGPVSAAGVLCDQIYIGDLFGDPPESPEEPPVPLVGPVAAFDVVAFDAKTLKPILSSLQTGENHHVQKSYASVAAKANFTFDASSSFDLNGTIISYYWDFGDGTNATGQVVSYNFTKTGTYTVTLTVTDNNTDTADAVETFTIEAGVGGVQVPVDKFAVAAPYIGAVSMVLAATVATTFYVKRFKRRKT